MCVIEESLISQKRIGNREESCVVNDLDSYSTEQGSLFCGYSTISSSLLLIIGVGSLTMQSRIQFLDKADVDK